MAPLCIRFGVDEQKAILSYGKLMPKSDDKRIRINGGNFSAAIREMCRRYGALCGYIQLPKDEWQKVRDDMNRGGVLKQLAGAK